MARVFSQTLTLKPQTLTLIRTLSPSILTPFRAKSSRASKATYIEVEIGSGSGSEPSSEIEVQMVARQIEDALHNIYAQRSAPDWLPFVPGSSYWVPPKSKRTAVAASDLVRLLKTTCLDPLNDEEKMAVRTARGWPSAAFFNIEGNQTKSKSKKATTQSDDEE